MTHLTGTPIPLPTARRTLWLPPIADVPLLVTAIEWPVFHLAVLPREWPLYALIDLVTEQAKWNRLFTCLLADSESVIAFPRPGELEIGRARWFNAPMVVDRLWLSRELPLRPEVLCRMAGLSRALRFREPERLPSALLGGHEAEPGEIERLAGTAWNGLPHGLERCSECGEPRGDCLRTHRGRALVVPVLCRCHPPSRCASCREPFHPRPLRAHWWDEAAGELRYVPGFPALEHDCPRRPFDDSRRGP